MKKINYEKFRALKSLSLIFANELKDYDKKIIKCNKEYFISESDDDLEKMMIHTIKYMYNQVLCE